MLSRESHPNFRRIKLIVSRPTPETGNFKKSHPERGELPRGGRRMVLENGYLALISNTASDAEWAEEMPAVWTLEYSFLVRKEGFYFRININQESFSFAFQSAVTRC
ncbi:hypothetical protein Zmor_004783 [Zophobas morio]|uniref:Uncharacterized protein n=1 Tax=Zophobas morio TaxID=2755281 RepID=A0AA38IS03_9CUCU|nr:hypothetical protein Zmor_004783 [Zophobas morio]